jgi:leucyl aminopeptidase
MELTIRVARSAALPHRLFFAFTDQADPFAAAPPELASTVLTLAAVREFNGAAGTTLLVPGAEGQMCWAGLGARGELTRPQFAEALAKGFAALREAGAARLAVTLPDGLPWGARQAARYAAEALWMSAYSFDRYRTRVKPRSAAKIELVVAGPAEGLAELEAGIAEGAHVGRAIALARDLINEPAAVAHPAFLVDQARQVAERAGAACRVIAGEELARQGYGAIHAVGRAAEHPPALVALETERAGPGRPTLALVGKGVTFDSGGLDLKPSSAMALMKKDLGGAATVLGAFQAISVLSSPLHLVCVLGLAENAVGPRSYRPGDIVTSKAGLTIEITNTDAEGRVVLADALVLAREYSPRWMVDFATLTGACRVALGKEIMGLFCDDAALREAIRDCAAATGEAVWPLPLWAPYKKKMESPVADLINATSDNMAGAVTAALFLQEFAGAVAWAHLDCYAWSDGDSPLFPKGGSGAGVRLLVELAERLVSR